MSDDAKVSKKEQKKAEDLAAVIEKIAEMPEPDRTMSKRIHALVTESAPELDPRLWYGMPAYAKDGKVVCFFQNSQKFGTRYSTLGFNDSATLDDGNMWPSAYAIMGLTPAEENRIVDLVRKAVSG